MRRRRSRIVVRMRPRRASPALWVVFGLSVVGIAAAVLLVTRETEARTEAKDRAEEEARSIPCLACKNGRVTLDPGTGRILITERMREAIRTSGSAIDPGQADADDAAALRFLSALARLRADRDMREMERHGKLEGIGDSGRLMEHQKAFYVHLYAISVTWTETPAGAPCPFCAGTGQAR